MTVPALKSASALAAADHVDVLLLGVHSTQNGPMVARPDSLIDVDLDRLQEGLASIGVTGAVDELCRLPVEGRGFTSLALIGLGSEPLMSGSLRYAAGSAARQLTGIDSLSIAFPVRSEGDLLAVFEGAAIGSYAYVDYRNSSLASTKLPASSIAVISTVPASEELIIRASIVAEAIHTVRDLVNMPPSDLYPESFADAVQQLSANADVDVTVLAENELRSGGYGGILGVGQGSARGPRLVKVDYAPVGADRHLALVGKGITFDSGGLSLKPPAAMVGMKYDMTGAATAMAVTVAAAKLGLHLRVTAWLCLAENLPSGMAVRPNDVLRIRGGKTVEVLNTDAEGRLVLADGLVAASEEHPDMIVDIATLTGAARVALGDRYTGLMGDESFVRRIADTAGAAGETMWPMPLPEELRSLLNSDVADIANARIGHTAAGMLLAGVFLKDFVGMKADGQSGQIPWAHLDIAGTASNPGAAYGHTGKGPTGVAVRTLLALAEDISGE